MRRVAVLAVGLALLVLGIASGIPELAMNGPSTEGVVGSIGAAVGLACVLLAARALLRGRRRRVQLLAVPFAIVALQWLVVPAVNAGLATHAPRDDPGSLPGARTVAFAASDGVRIAGWLVPGTRHQAIVLLHGSHGSRSDLVAHARMLQHAGFAVLALDSRGHGASEGHTNALGWEAENDIAGAVAYLGRRGYAHVGALGLSMGAEAALRAAAEGVRLEAVVADGAGASTSGDLRLVTHGRLAPVERSVSWLTMRGIEALSGTDEPVPLRDAVRRIDVPVMLIASGRSGELAIATAYRKNIAGPASVWSLPDVGHTKGLSTHRALYAKTVTAFLRDFLSVS